MKKVDKLKEKLLEYEPYFGTLLSTIPIHHKKVKDFPALAGIGVDKKFNNLMMFLREDLFDLSEKEQVAVIVHELFHVVFGHMVVTAANPMLFNMAADFVINQEIPNLPKDTLRVEDFDLPPKLGVWEYYELLQKKGTKPQKGFDDHSQFGSAGLKEACQEAIIKADALEKHNGNPNKDRPTTSKVFNDAKREFIVGSHRDIVKKILHNVCKLTLQAKDMEKTYARESRRYQDFPGNQVEEMPKIFLAIDTSGSITDDQLNDAVSVVLELSKRIGAEVKVGLWNTSCYNVESIKSAKDIGRIKPESGGTDIEDTFKVMSKLKPDLTVIVTDGYFDMPTTKPSGRIVWVLNAPNDGFNEPRTVRM